MGVGEGGNLAQGVGTLKRGECWNPLINYVLKNLLQIVLNAIKDLSWAVLNPI